MTEINIGAKGRACPRYAIFTRIASSENKIESKSYRRIARIYIIIYSERESRFIYKIRRSLFYTHTRLCVYLEIHSRGGIAKMRACAEGSPVNSLQNKAGRFFNDDNIDIASLKADNNALTMKA